jgi:hypothetical protein
LGRSSWDREISKRDKNRERKRTGAFRGFHMGALSEGGGTTLDVTASSSEYRPVGAPRRDVGTVTARGKVIVQILVKS